MTPLLCSRNLRLRYYLEGKDRRQFIRKHIDVRTKLIFIAGGPTSRAYNYFTTRTAHTSAIQKQSLGNKCFPNKSCFVSQVVFLLVFLLEESCCSCCSRTCLAAISACRSFQSSSRRVSCLSARFWYPRAVIWATSTRVPTCSICCSIFSRLSVRVATS